MFGNYDNYLEIPQYGLASHTLPERSIFVISAFIALSLVLTIATATAIIRLENELNKLLKIMRETAKRQRDHYDYWYRILDRKDVKRSSIVQFCFMMPISLEMIQHLEKLIGLQFDGTNPA